MDCKGLVPATFSSCMPTFMENFEFLHTGAHGDGLLLHNIVKVCGSARRYTKFINKRTDAGKIDVNLFLTMTNYQIVRTRSLMHCINYNSCVCPLIDNEN